MFLDNISIVPVCRPPTLGNFRTVSFLTLLILICKNTRTKFNLNCYLLSELFSKNEASSVKLYFSKTMSVFLINPYVSVMMPE